MTETVERDSLLRWVFLTATGLGAVAICVSLAVAELDVTAGLLVGVLVALGNFWALRRLGARLAAGAASGHGAGATAGLFGLKFLIYAGILYAIVRLVPVDMMALMGGLSVVVISIVLGSLVGPPPDASNSNNAESGESSHG